MPDGNTMIGALPMEDVPAPPAPPAADPPAGGRLARAAEYVLHLWFIGSLAVVTSYAGWSAVRFGAHWSTFAACAASLLWVPILLKSQRLPALAAKAAVATLALALGVAGAVSNYQRVNEWMDNSLATLSSTLDPVREYDEGGERVVVTHQEQAQLRRLSEASLHIFDHDLAERMLVAFGRGLAVVDRDGAHFLTTTGSFLSLLSMPPDGSILYYKGGRYGPSGSEGDSSSQSSFSSSAADHLREMRYTEEDYLVRAVLRGNALYKVWEAKVPTLSLHHWGDEFDGKVYVPGREFEDLPNETSQRIGHAYAECVMENGWRDNVRVLDLETGRVERTIDLLPLIADQSWAGNAMAQRIDDCQDPLHLNDVQVVKTAQHAAYFPDGKVGDLLLSLRHNDTILLLDRDTSAVKWSVTGLTNHQHSPRISDHGTIIAFDNYGSDPKNGQSRVTEIGIATRAVTGYWEASGTDHFDGQNRGKVTLHNGRILVQDQESSDQLNTLFILDCPGGRVSMQCVKTTVFAGEAKDFRYNNLVLL